MQDSNGEYLNLPMTTSLDKLRDIREGLMAGREKYAEKSNAASSERKEPIGAAAAAAEPSGQQRKLDLPSPAGSTSTAVPSSPTSGGLLGGAPAEYMSRMVSLLAVSLT
jgi:hypothetical protein